VDSEEGANEIKDKCELILERINIAEPAGETTEPIFNGSVLTLQSLSKKLVEYITKASSRRAASHIWRADARGSTRPPVGSAWRTLREATAKRRVHCVEHRAEPGNPPSRLLLSARQPHRPT
jgi:hypothetical protein